MKTYEEAYADWKKAIAERDNFTIPPEAVEAAAIVLMSRLMVSHKDALHVWSGMYEPEKDQFRREAAAALRAGIAAWPGALTERRARCDAVVLPFNLDADIGVIALPTENTNAES